MAKKRINNFKNYFFIGVVIILLIVLILGIIVFVNNLNSGNTLQGSNHELSTVGYVTLTIVEPIIQEGEGVEKQKI